MNMFEKENGIFGNGETADCLNHDFEEFIKQAQIIRKRLGKQKYLLDQYLSTLFETTNQQLVYSTASDGFGAAGELIGICAGIIRGESSNADHSYFEQAREYINTHPLNYQELYTQTSMYCVLLNSDFMKTTAEEFFIKVKNESIAVLDICDLHELYSKICDLLGGEEAMERLNLLFRQRFLIADTMAIFHQAMTNQLLYSLTYRDRETSKQIFQLLLDGEF